MGTKIENIVMHALATPLNVQQTVPGASWAIFDWNAEPVATCVTEERAYALKLAVNKHERLVGALIAAQSVISEEFNGIPGRGGKRIDSPNNRVLDLIRAALEGV